MKIYAYIENKIKRFLARLLYCFYSQKQASLSQALTEEIPKAGSSQQKVPRNSRFTGPLPCILPLYFLADASIT